MTDARKTEPYNSGDTQGLVLYFDPKDPVTSDHIRTRLIQVSPNVAERINQLVSRGRIVLKRNADPIADQHIVNLWAGTGAVCRFEVLNGDPKPNPASIKGATPDTPEPPAGMMMCPQCRHNQPIGPECRKCGIIIAKVRMKAQGPPPQIDSAPPAKAAPRSALSDWKRFGPQCAQIVEWAKKAMGGRTQTKPQLIKWSRRFIDAFTGLLLVSVIALILSIGSLYLANAMWFVYESTPVGQHYIAMPGSLGPDIQYLAQMDLALLGLNVTAAALLVCLSIGVVGQLFHLIRIFYEPLGLLAKTILWAIPLSGITAWWISGQDAMIPFSIACMISLVPVLLVLNRSLMLAGILVPEISMLVSVLGAQSGVFIKRLGMLKKR